MDYFPLNWGKPRANDQEFNWLSVPKPLPSPYDYVAQIHPSNDNPIKHTQSPIVTGTSVIAFKYKDGIMMATDCLASYGSLARFRDVQRMIPVGQYSVVGASGDISDFQYLSHQLENLMIQEFNTADQHLLGPENVFEYLHRLMYSRRSKMNFLWNTLIVGGIKNGKSYLGCVDMRGVTYSATTLATGFGAHLAQPILREKVEGRESTITEEEAHQIMDTVMRVLFYRDARSLNKIQRATVNGSGVHITKPYSVPTEWDFAESIRGYGASQP